ADGPCAKAVVLATSVSTTAAMSVVGKERRWSVKRSPNFPARAWRPAPHEDAIGEDMRLASPKRRRVLPDCHVYLSVLLAARSNFVQGGGAFVARDTAA